MRIQSNDRSRIDRMSRMDGWMVGGDNAVVVVVHIKSGCPEFHPAVHQYSI